MDWEPTHKLAETAYKTSYAQETLLMLPNFEMSLKSEGCTEHDSLLSSQNTRTKEDNLSMGTWEEMARNIWERHLTTAKELSQSTADMIGSNTENIS